MKLANIAFHLNLLHRQLIGQINVLAASFIDGRNDNLGIAASFENILKGNKMSKFRLQIYNKKKNE